jgi:hypothetical protein
MPITFCWRFEVPHQKIFASTSEVFWPHVESLRAMTCPSRLLPTLAIFQTDKIPEESREMGTRAATKSPKLTPKSFEPKKLYN